MFLRYVSGLLLCLSTVAFTQTLSTPSTFRLVTPKGPGSITINTGGGWTVERFVLYDEGTRAVIFSTNQSLGIAASYILSNDESFDYSKESCKGDVLGPIMAGPLKQATVKNKQNSSHILPDGHALDIGSYLIAKSEGVTLNQQNVFGFIAQGHTCAEVHLSRTPFKEGEEHLFDSTLDSFKFDVTYVPSAADYALMAKLLPPGMASAYVTKQETNSTPTTPTDAAQSLTFALPDHPGVMHMDAPNFAITELSAKPNGHEFGIRADDKTISHAEFLGFLFLPAPPQPTAAACRDWMLRSEASDGVKDRKILRAYEDTSESGIPIALVDYEQTKAPSKYRFVRRFFVAKGDLCLDASITATNDMAATPASILYKTIAFDATKAPDFFAKFRYAQVIFDHHNPAGAAPIYESAIPLAEQTDKPLQWRRVTIDQASMSYGMAGDLKRSRDINLAAITKDPDYPLYYYNLACADAEAGDAKAAREHLQQAFDRRANTLPGEKMPDPSTDDSIIKLKKNKDFWAFVQSLPKM
jgi:hypothetical protein